MTQSDSDVLKKLAGKYIWWKTPDEAIAMPERIVAQFLASQLGEDALRDVLLHAEAGQFNPRSWAYWHYRLGLASRESVPPLPVRRFG